MDRSCIPTEKLENDSYDWYERHAEKLEAVRTHRYDIILMGDSITHFWETAHGPETWKALFGKRNVLNLGFGWDRTCNLLWRLEHGEFANQTPKVFVLHIGTNNFSKTEHYAGDTPLETAHGIAAVVEKIHALSPDTRIVLMKIFPRGLNCEPFRAKIVETNALLEKIMSDKPYVELHDIGAKMMKDGELNTALYLDNCHLQEAGYRVWASELEEVFRKYGL